MIRRYTSCLNHVVIGIFAVFALATAVTGVQFEEVANDVGVNGFCCTEVAWGDYNNDGWVDIYSDSLWRNNEGTFSKVDGPFEGSGIWGDFDNDGDLDLYMYAEGTLARNDGDDKFIDVSGILDERPIGICRGAAWGDFNGDGYLDLYITGYENWDTGGEWHDVIFRNNAGKSFTNIWQTPSIRRARGVTCADYDEDGDLDIYVSNYRLQPNWLFRNDGDFTFTDVAMDVSSVAGDGDQGAWGHTVGSAWCDFDNDGHIDLFVGNFSHPPAYQDRCKFYRNVATVDGRNFQAHPGEILRWQESYGTPAFGDFDNNGFLDLYLTTLYGGDRSSLFQNTSAALNIHPGEDVVGLPADTWAMADVTDATGTAHSGSYQAAWADFDNDGDLDLATGGLIFRNRMNEDTPEAERHHWIKVRLKGEGINAYAIGAEVRIRPNHSRWILTRQVEGGTGEGNQNDLTLHFGLRNHSAAVELQVIWPDGTEQVQTSEVDRTVEIVKDTPNAFHSSKISRRRMGYVVFEHSPMVTLQPRHVPEPERIVDTISCVLAQEEYESIQLGVHALAAGIKDIEVTVESDLRVTTYHRISAADKEKLAVLSVPPDHDEVGRWIGSSVHLQRGNVYEALDSGDSVNFWLTFHADKETEPGVHQGKIRIKPAGRPETVLDLNVTVRPFELQPPRAAFGIWFREDMLPKRLGGLATPRDTVLAIYQDMAVHGHNSSIFYPGGDFGVLPPENSHSLDKLIPLAHQAGLLDPNIPSLIIGGIPGDLKGEKLAAAVDWLRQACRDQGWPEMLTFVSDEPKYPQQDNRITAMLTKVRDISTRSTIDVGASAAYGYGYLTDVMTVHDGLISPELMAESQRRGTEIWTYTYRMWRKDMDPLRQRYYAGFYTWAFGLGGNWVWAYHHNHHRHAWFPPDSHEPMPLTALEARREGIDDYRYLQMLEDSVAAHPDNPAAREAAKWLEALRPRIIGTAPYVSEAGKPLALTEYDQIRDQAAAFIEQLGPVTNEDLMLSPITGARDEAAAYRGKSVVACIVGLKKPNVSQRRAAAWALFEMGKAAAPAAEALASLLEDPGVRVPALRALEAIGPEAVLALPELTKLLGHPDFYIRVGAMLTLAEIGCPLDKREIGGKRMPSAHAAVVSESLVIAFLDEFPTIAHEAAEVMAAFGSFARPALQPAIEMLDHADPGRQIGALRVITALGPDAAPAVPKLIEMLSGQSQETRCIEALAAIGPAAAAAITTLEQHAAKQAGADQSALYALCCIRGDISDFRKLIDLLEDANVDAATKKQVVTRLDQLGAKAQPVADEIRRLLTSEAPGDWQEGLKSFLENVDKGSVP
jgi:HEAT repeat protein